MPDCFRCLVRGAPIWCGLTVLSGLAAALIFLFRGDLLWLEYQGATLGDVYGIPPSLGARITGFDNDGGQLTIFLEQEGDCRKWLVENSRQPPRIVTGDDPIVALVEGRHHYRVTPQACATGLLNGPLEFDIAYQANGDIGGGRKGDLINLFETPLKVAVRPGPRLARWIPPVDDYPADEVARARAFLAGIGVTDKMTAEEKLRTVSQGLLARIKSGQPPATLDSMTPMQVVDTAVSGGIPLFCRQRALMKAFLLNVAGVPTRIVWTGRSIDGVLMSSHAFTESYMADQGRWAYSDLSHGIPYLTDGRGRVLNAVDMLFLFSSGATDGAGVDWSARIGGPPEPGGEVLKSLAGVFTRNAILQYWGAHDRFVQQINPPFLTKLKYRFVHYLFEPTVYLGLQRGYAFHWLRGATILATLFCALMSVIIAWRRRA